MWNPSTCAWECDKLCDVGQYLDYKNCKCRKKLIEQCTTVVDLKIGNGTDLLTSKESSSSNIYLYLFVAMLIIAILLVAGVVYYCRKDNSKKFEDKIYETAYSNTGTLNFFSIIKK